MKMINIPVLNYGGNKVDLVIQKYKKVQEITKGNKC